MKTCKFCGGSGHIMAVHTFGMAPCPTCKGIGKITSPQADKQLRVAIFNFRGEFVRFEPCNVAWRGKHIFIGYTEQDVAPITYAIYHIASGYRMSMNCEYLGLLMKVAEEYDQHPDVDWKNLSRCTWSSIRGNILSGNYDAHKIRESRSIWMKILRTYLTLAGTPKEELTGD